MSKTVLNDPCIYCKHCFRVDDIWKCYADSHRRDYVPDEIEDVANDYRPCKRWQCFLPGIKRKEGYG